MNRLHLQLAFDCSMLQTATAMAAVAAPLVDTIEVGAPLLIREGVAAVVEMSRHTKDHRSQLFADTKISDEGASIARICFDAGADVVSVVDGASTRTLREVRAVADEYGRQVWVDLLSHSNPIIRAQALKPYVDGYIVNRPRSGLPPLLLEGLLSADRPLRVAGGLTLELARRIALAAHRVAEEGSATAPIEGIIVGRAITEADNFRTALAAFLTICHPEEAEPELPVL